MSTWNFGSAVQRRSAVKDLAAENFKTMASSIQCAQEISCETHDFIATNGWVGTPSMYAKSQSAPADNGLGCGLAIFAKDTVAKRIEVLRECCSFPKGSAKWRSPILVAVVHFHVARCGFEAFPVCNTHLHYTVAKGGKAEKRPAPAGTQRARREYFDTLARSLATSRARILVGDMNMSVFTVVAELAKRGILATLVAHHMELDSDAQPLYDSCGIWVIGPLATVKPAEPARHVLAGAAHPAVMEMRGSAFGKFQDKLSATPRSRPLVSVTVPTPSSRHRDLRQRIAAERGSGPHTHALQAAATSPECPTRGASPRSAIAGMLPTLRRTMTC